MSFFVGIANSPSFHRRQLSTPTRLSTSGSIAEETRPATSSSYEAAQEDSRDVLVQRLNDLAQRLQRNTSLSEATVSKLHHTVNKLEKQLHYAEWQSQVNSLISNRQSPVSDASRLDDVDGFWSSSLSPQRANWQRRFPPFPPNDELHESELETVVRRADDRHNHHGHLLESEDLPPVSGETGGPDKSDEVSAKQGETEEMEESRNDRLECAAHEGAQAGAEELRSHRSVRQARLESIHHELELPSPPELETISTVDKLLKATTAPDSTASADNLQDLFALDLPQPRRASIGALPELKPQLFGEELQRTASAFQSSQLLMGTEQASETSRDLANSEQGVETESSGVNPEKMHSEPDILGAIISQESSLAAEAFQDKTAKSSISNAEQVVADSEPAVEPQLPHSRAALPLNLGPVVSRIATEEHSTEPVLFESGYQSSQVVSRPEAAPSKEAVQDSQNSKERHDESQDVLSLPAERQITRGASRDERESRHIPSAQVVLRTKQLPMSMQPLSSHAPYSRSISQSPPSRVPSSPSKSFIPTPRGAPAPLVDASKSAPQVDKATSRARIVSQKAEELCQRLNRTMKDIKERREEASHLHNLLVARAERAAQRILALESHVKDLDEEFGANRSELSFLRLQLRALEVQFLQYVPADHDQELSESIKNWKSDWASVDQRTRSRRMKCRNSVQQASFDKGNKE